MHDTSLEDSEQGRGDGPLILTTATTDHPLSVNPVVLVALDDGDRYARASCAAATRRAYTSDWAHFEGWSRAHGLLALPTAPLTASAYFGAHGQILAPSTLTRRLSAIAVAHRLAGHQLDTRHPAIRDVLAGIRRTRGVAPKRAAPATTEIIRLLVQHCDRTQLLGLRDAALVLGGIAGALRRAELVALTCADIALTQEVARLTLRRSKADQNGAGELVAIARSPGSATCPVAALEAWLVAAAIIDGPVFRAVNRHGQVGKTQMNDRSVARVVQKLAAAAGFAADTFSGHSLRAGFATAAAARGVEEWRIARHTRHRSAVVRVYIRKGAIMARTPSREIGL